jgi:hypothetical protein
MDCSLKRKQLKIKMSRSLSPIHEKYRWRTKFDELRREPDDICKKLATREKCRLSLAPSFPVLFSHAAINREAHS